MSKSNFRAPSPSTGQTGQPRRQGEPVNPAKRHDGQSRPPRRQSEQASSPRRQTGRPSPVSHQTRQEPAPIQLPAEVFSRPDLQGLALLERLPEILSEVFPLSGADKRHLPYKVALLSENLTSHRSRLTADSYWASPALTSAYLWYFLPWNLVRLMGLLPGLKLELAPEDKILDLGSGPLALPLALWLSRPDLRELPLRFTCLDSAALPLRLGHAIFRALAGPDSPWRFKTVSEAMFRALPRQDRDFSLLTACNMLNELKPERRVTLAQHLAHQMDELGRHLKPGGRMLVVEPGNRLGGKIILAARTAVLRHGFIALGPCPHQGPCPLAARESGHDAHDHTDRQGHAPASWCHFTCPRKSVAVPSWLDRLSRDAHLSKDKLTLSWLFLEKGAGQGQPAAKTEERTPTNIAGGASCVLPGRVVSNSLVLPGREGQFFYVCSGRGLVLLRAARPLRSGESVTLSFTGNEDRDPKSGAWIVTQGGA